MIQTALLYIPMLLSAASPEAGTASEAADLFIYTNGGGELFKNVFEQINNIFGVSGFKSFIKFGLMIGAFCAACLAFFRQSFEPLIRQFLIPAICIVGLLGVKTIPIQIKDDGKAMPKQDAPFVLAKIAGWTSELFYQLECKIQPKEQYRWTRHLQENDNGFLPGKFPIRDSELERNFREFVADCVFRDIGVGRYSKEALRSSPNIWEFLNSNSSNILTVSYLNGHKVECKSCKDAAEKMKNIKSNDSFSKEEFWKLYGEQSQNDLQKQDVTKEEDRVKQRFAIDLLRQEFPNTQSISTPAVWAQIASALVYIRIFFEALVYLIFPVIVILSLATFGIRMVIYWIKFLVWVHVWSIGLIGVDLFLNAVWSVRKSALFGSKSLITFETTQTLGALYSSMEIVACFALACVPILSWMLIKGSSSQLAQLVSSGTSTKAEVPDQQAPDAFNPTKVEEKETSRQIFSGMTFSSEESTLDRGVHRSEPTNEAIPDTIHKALHSIEEAVKESSEYIAEAISESVGPRPESNESKDSDDGGRMHSPSPQWNYENKDQ